jgi:hypothetical protein
VEVDGGVIGIGGDAGDLEIDGIEGAKAWKKLRNPERLRFAESSTGGATGLLADVKDGRSEVETDSEV